MALFLIIENASLATNYPDVRAACTKYTTVTAPKATAESFFSELKLITSFFRSSMSQEKLSGLGLLSIENERAQNYTVRKLYNS